MGEIAKDTMYICEFLETGKWEIRKVKKSTVKTEASYSIVTEYNKGTEEGIAECDCKGFEHHGHCKHIEMVGGKLAPQDGQTTIESEEQVGKVKEFLDGYSKAQFGSKIFILYVPENEGIAERFDIVCAADERKLMWTTIPVPIEDGKETATIVVRVIMSVDFDDDVDSLLGKHEDEEAEEEGGDE